MAKQRLIVNADDFGLCEEVNRAIIELTGQGVVTSTSVMSNMPAFDEVSKIKSRVGIGVHLNLTSGGPVLPEERVSTLVNATGCFFKLPVLLSRARQGKILHQEVMDEMEAQIRRVLQAGIEPDHINSHQSLLKYPYFFSIITSLAKKYDIPAIRVYRRRQMNHAQLFKPVNLLKLGYLEYQRLHLRLSGFAVANRFDSLLRPGLDAQQAFLHLADLANDSWQGVLELVVHPGYYHPADEVLGNYTREREVELRTLADSSFRETLLKCGVELISFAQMIGSRPGGMRRFRAVQPARSPFIY